MIQQLSDISLFIRNGYHIFFRQTDIYRSPNRTPRKDLKALPAGTLQNKFSVVAINRVQRYLHSSHVTLSPALDMEYT